MGLILNVIILIMSFMTIFILVRNIPLFSNPRVKYSFSLLVLLPIIRDFFITKDGLEYFGIYLSENSEPYFLLGFGLITAVIGFYSLIIILKIAPKYYAKNEEEDRFKLT